MRTHRNLWLALSLLLATADAARAAGEFSDTTTGSVEEGKEANGLPSERALTTRGQNIMRRFKEGRTSSANNVSSRFAGSLEMHDANLDGVVDHEVGEGNNNLEGRMANLLPPGKNLEERARESSKAANKKSCGNEFGTVAKNGSSACFSPSGIIVDMGAAHGDDKDPHRKLRMTEEAMEAAKGAGEEYGAATIRDIETMMKDEYGLKNKKVAAIDHLKSEAAWLEEQKLNNYNRAWKSMRAARLAGMDDAEDTAAGGDGAEFMHDVDLMVSKKSGDTEIAQEIALRNEIQNAQFVKQGSNWVPYDAQAYEKANPTARTPPVDELKTFADLKRDPAKPLEDANLRSQLHEQARTAALDRASKNPEFQENIEKIVKCLDKDTWCHNENTAGQANNQAPAGQPNAPQIKAFDALGSGDDPGAVFQDTRELIYLKFADAQKAPIDEIEGIVSNYDFNRETDPEYFKQLDKLKEEAGEMQKANEARGNNFYNTGTQSVQQMFGITEGVNDSFREEDTEAPVGNRKPAGAGNRPGSPKQGATGPMPGDSGPASRK